MTKDNVAVAVVLKTLKGRKSPLFPPFFTKLSRVSRRRDSGNRGLQHSHALGSGILGRQDDPDVFADDGARSRHSSNGTKADRRASHSLWRLQLASDKRRHRIRQRRKSRTEPSRISALQL